MGITKTAILATELDAVNVMETSFRARRWTSMLDDVNEG